MKRAARVAVWTLLFSSILLVSANAPLGARGSAIRVPTRLTVPGVEHFIQIVTPAVTIEHFIQTVTPDANVEYFIERVPKAKSWADVHPERPWRRVIPNHRR